MDTKEKAPLDERGNNGDGKHTTNNSIFTDRIKTILTGSDVYTPKDLDNADGAEITYLVDGLIPERQVTMLTGKPGDGKTTLLFALIASVLSGEPFAGRAVVQKPVVVWDSENSLSTLKALKDMAGINDNILFIKNPPSYKMTTSICVNCPSICKRTAYDMVAAQYNYNVVFVFDSRARFENEDSNTDRTKYLNAFFAELRDKGVTILLIHHASAKNADNDSLGSTEIVAGVDNHYKLTAPKQGQKYHLLENKKNRFFKETFSMLLQISRDPLKATDVTATVRESNIAKLAAIIFETVKPNQGNIIAGARDKLSWGYHKIRSVLKEGTGTFWTEEKLKHNETVYTLTTEGMSVLNLGEEGAGEDNDDEDENNGCSQNCTKGTFKVHPSLSGLQRWCISKKDWCIYTGKELF